MITRGQSIAFGTTSLATLFAAMHSFADNQAWLTHGVPPVGTSTLLWAGSFMVAWALMTTAMTLPSLTGLLEATSRVGGSVATFASGLMTLGVWMVAGFVVWFLLFESASWLSALPPGGIERYAAIALLLAAAYQVSPFARGCQEQCARPLGIIARHWGNASSLPSAALWIGLDYGWNCVGCCVPMIVIMFVVGMGDVRWLAAMALLMVTQKNTHWGSVIAHISAVGLVAAGGAILVGWWEPDLLSLRELCGNRLAL